MTGRQLLSWALGAASIVVPLAAVLMTLSFSGPWVVLSLAGGAAFSVLLIELAARGQYPAGMEPRPGPARVARPEPAVAVLDVYGKRVDVPSPSDRR